jgi:hypothetical protein
MAKRASALSLRWKQTKNGWITKLGAGRPEIVVLQLTDDEYKQMLKRPKAYFEKLRIFSKKPNKVKFCVTYSGSKGCVWNIVITHTPNSTLAVTSWQPPL